MKHIIPFEFESQTVRVVDQAGEPWFVLVDACRVLDISNTGNAAARLDDDEKATIQIPDSGNLNADRTIISESGLWSLVLRSRKPQAKRFRRWITGEVIPSIRKTGGYGHVADAPPFNDGLAAVKETRFSFGKQAAREMWFRMGLPTVPSMFAPASQPDFFLNR